jgi:hypothetical protein
MELLMNRMALFTTAALAWLGTAAVAPAQTLAGYNNENRIVLALRVSPAAAQAWLPAPWQVEPIGSGPSRGANLLVVFHTPWLIQDAAGKPTAAPIDRRVAIEVPAKHPQTGETTEFVVRVYHANPNAAPGFYRVSVPVTVREEQAVKGSGVEPPTGTETWDVRDASGGLLEFRLEYQGGVPTRVKAEASPHSAVDPKLFQIYRIDHGLDVVKSVPDGINRVRQYTLRVTMSELRRLFDGTEQLVSASLLPWYIREVFRP